MSPTGSYPEAIEGPRVAATQPPDLKNPCISGLPLIIGAWAATTFNPVSSFLWANGGFGVLRTIRELDHYEPRYDPTVSAARVGGSHDHDALRPELYRENMSSKSPNTSILEYHNAYKAQKVTPADVCIALLELCETDDECKIAFVSVNKEEVLAAATASESRFRAGKSKGILDGVPVAIKDEIDLKGHPMRLGTTKDYSTDAKATSWCVTQWQEAGAIIIGKLNMHEIGLDTSGNNPNIGTPLNPHAPDHYPGGSSSASATIVARNIVPLTIGCDAGGSIRIPSNYNLLYGLKPTHGKVCRMPTKSLAFSTSVIGPFAGCVEDLRIGYEILAKPYPGRAMIKHFGEPKGAVPGDNLTQSTNAKFVLGVCHEWINLNTDRALQTAFWEAIQYFRQQGHEIIDIEIPFTHEGQLAHAMTVLSEMSSGFRERGNLTPSNRILLAVGSQTPATDFLLAQRMRSLQMSHLAFLFQKHPGLLILSPTTPNIGWPIRSPADLTRGIIDGNFSVRSMTYVWLANFTGCPAISIPLNKIPSGKGKNDVPVGLMAMAEWGGEEALLEWARLGEAAAWSGHICSRSSMSRPSGNFWVDPLELAKLHKAKGKHAD